MSQKKVVNLCDDQIVCSENCDFSLSFSCFSVQCFFLLWKEQIHKWKWMEKNEKSVGKNRKVVSQSVVP